MIAFIIKNILEFKKLDIDIKLPIWQKTYNESEYFYSLYFGGNGSVGIRVDPVKSKFAYEVRPLNVHVGNKGFILGYLMFGIDFKLVE